MFLVWFLCPPFIFGCCSWPTLTQNSWIAYSVDIISGCVQWNICPFYGPDLLTSQTFVWPQLLWLLLDQQGQPVLFPKLFSFFLCVVRVYFVIFHLLVISLIDLGLGLLWSYISGNFTIHERFKLIHGNQKWLCKTICALVHAHEDCACVISSLRDFVLGQNKN